MCRESERERRGGPDAGSVSRGETVRRGHASWRSAPTSRPRQPRARLRRAVERRAWSRRSNAKQLLRGRTCTRRAPRDTYDASHRGGDLLAWGRRLREFVSGTVAGAARRPWHAPSFRPVTRERRRSCSACGIATTRCDESSARDRPPTGRESPVCSEAKSFTFTPCSVKKSMSAPLSQITSVVLCLRSKRGEK